MSYLLNAVDLTVERGDKTILNRVSLSIGFGDFITVIGPNGAGKSMLLKCLMGFYQADSGVLNRHSALKIGYLPQSFEVDWTIPITVQRFLKLGKKSSPQEAQQAIEQAKIERFLKQPLQVLSGGEMQRVMLARALLDQPNLLVLDEPAQNLDVTGQLEFYRLIEQIHRQQKLAILMVSHDLHFVMSSSNQVICLYHHVCCSGAPQAVSKDPEFVELFGPEMAKLMSVYHHHHDHVHHHGGASHD